MWPSFASEVDLSDYLLEIFPCRLSFGEDSFLRAKKEQDFWSAVK